MDTRKVGAGEVDRFSKASISEAYRTSERCKVERDRVFELAASQALFRTGSLGRPEVHTAEELCFREVRMCMKAAVSKLCGFSEGWTCEMDLTKSTAENLKRATELALPKNGSSGQLA